ncbi:MAG: hypothetical protein ACP5VN_10900 [Acidobacteriota bacterium]
MGGGVGRILPVLSRRRKLLALFLAGLADLVEIALFPLFLEGAASPFDLLLDLLTAGALWAVAGFRWRYLVAFAAEALPFVSLFPTWTALVLTLPSEGGQAPRRVGPDPAEGEGKERRSSLPADRA